MAVAIINVTEKRASFVNQDFSALLDEVSIPIDALAAAIASSTAEQPTAGECLANAVIARLEADFGSISDRVRGLLYLPLGRDKNSESYMVVEGQSAVLAALEPRSISQSYLALALQSSGLGAWSLNVQTHQAERSLSHDAIFGYDGFAPHWDLDVFLSHVVEEDRPRVRDAFVEAISKQDTWKFTCKIQRLDGEVRWIEASGYPRGPGDTSVTHYIGLLKDTTAEINAAEQRRLLFAELHHRVRNNLAVVHSLASSTFRMAPDTVGAAHALRRRITALSDAHNLLLDASNAPVSVKQAIANVASHIIPVPALQIEGDDSELSLSHVVPLSMWIMELLSRVPSAQSALVELRSDQTLISVRWTTPRPHSADWGDKLSEPLVLNILPAQMGGRARLDEKDDDFSVVLTIRPAALHGGAPSQHTLTATTMML